MDKSKIVIGNEKNEKETFDVLFVVEREEFNYVAFKSIKGKSVYFGKYKENGKVIRNLTNKEEEQMSLILNKFVTSN